MGIRVARLDIDVAAFKQTGLVDLEKTMRLAWNHVSIVIIGEIARRELVSPGFVQAIEAVFAGSLAVVATVHVHEHPVTDALKRRHEIELITLAETNRDDLPAQLFHQLTGSAPQGASG